MPGILDLLARTGFEAPEVAEPYPPFVVLWPEPWSLPVQLPAGVQEWLAGDPEATTYQFVVRAVKSEAASQLAASRRSLGEEIAERALLADHVQKLQTDVAWRAGVMEQLGAKVALLEGSRSFRYMAPLRRLSASLRRLRG